MSPIPQPFPCTKPQRKVMDETPYPTRTIHIVSKSNDVNGHEDDDVSTLSGCSGAVPHSPKRPPPRYMQKLQNSRRLQPYLNGKLPKDVTAVLGRKQKAGRKNESNSNHEAARKIPHAIDVTIENGNSQGRGELSENVKNGDRLKNKALALKHKRNNPSSPSSPRGLEGQISPSCSAVLCHRNSTNNAARRQRVQKIQRLKFGEKAVVSSSVSSCNGSERKIQPGQKGPDSPDKNESLEDKNKGASQGKNGEGKTPLLTLPPTSLLTLPPKIEKKKNPIDCLADELRLAKPTTTKARPTPKPKPLSAVQKKYLLASSYSPRREKAKEKDMPRAHSHSPRSYNGRIHRSFWSVPAEQSPQEANLNGRDSPNDASPSSVSEGGALIPRRARLMKLVQTHYNAPMAEPMVRAYSSDSLSVMRTSVAGDARPRGYLQQPILSCPGKPLRATVTPQPVKNSDGDGNGDANVNVNEFATKCGKNQSSKLAWSAGGNISNANQIDSNVGIDALTNFYDGVMNQFSQPACAVANALKATAGLDEPPTLKRLMIGSDSCPVPACDPNYDNYSDSDSDSASETDSQTDSDINSDSNSEDSSRYSTFEHDNDLDGVEDSKADGFEIKLTNAEGGQLKSFEDLHSINTTSNDKEDRASFLGGDSTCGETMSIDADHYYHKAFNALSHHSTCGDSKSIDVDQRYHHAFKELSHCQEGSFCSGTNAETVFLNSSFETHESLNDNENDSKYYAQISIDISGKSKPVIDQIIAEFEKDISKATSSEGSVCISVTSSHPKCDQSQSTERTPHTVETPGTEEEISQCTTATPSSQIKAASRVESNRPSGYDIDHLMLSPSEKRCTLNVNLRRGVLATPTNAIVKKIRNATVRMLKKPADKKNKGSNKLHDHMLLLPKSRKDRAQSNDSPEPDNWFTSSPSPKTRERDFIPDPGNYVRFL